MLRFQPLPPRSDRPVLAASMCSCKASGPKICRSSSGRGSGMGYRPRLSSTSDKPMLHTSDNTEYVAPWIRSGWINRNKSYQKMNYFITNIYETDLLISQSIINHVNKICKSHASPMSIYIYIYEHSDAVKGHCSVFVVLKWFYVFFVFLVAFAVDIQLFNACFYHLYHIDALNDHIKWVFIVVKRKTNVKSHCLHALVQICNILQLYCNTTAPLFNYTYKKTCFILSF